MIYQSDVMPSIALFLQKKAREAKKKAKSESGSKKQKGEVA